MEFIHKNPNDILFYPPVLLFFPIPAADISDLIQKYEIFFNNIDISASKVSKHILYSMHIPVFRKSFLSPYHSFIITQSPTIIAMSDKT